MPIEDPQKKQCSTNTKETPMLKNREASRLMREFCAELRVKYKLPPNTTNNAVVYDVLTLMNRLGLTNSKAQRLCKLSKLRKLNHEKYTGGSNE